MSASTVAAQLAKAKTRCQRIIEQQRWRTRQEGRRAAGDDQVNRRPPKARRPAREGVRAS
ncbi:hypothetical protein [Paraburkholderia sp. 40]|uniref:hypothetical protein n=1 Tax=Paraburkholderia sp. 40 TaxID=2991059 RepID=UPI003D229763